MSSLNRHHHHYPHYPLNHLFIVKIIIILLLIALLCDPPWVAQRATGVFHECWHISALPFVIHSFHCTVCFRTCNCIFCIFGFTFVFLYLLFLLQWSTVYTYKGSGVYSRKEFRLFPGVGFLSSWTHLYKSQTWNCLVENYFQLLEIHLCEHVSEQFRENKFQMWYSMHCALDNFSFKHLF